MIACSPRGEFFIEYFTLHLSKRFGPATNLLSNNIFSSFIGFPSRSFLVRSFFPMKKSIIYAAPVDQKAIEEKRPDHCHRQRRSVFPGSCLAAGS